MSLRGHPSVSVFVLLYIKVQILGDEIQFISHPLFHFFHLSVEILGDEIQFINYI